MPAPPVGVMIQNYNKQGGWSIAVANVGSEWGE